MNGGCTAHAKAFITAVAVAQHRDLGVKLRGIMLHERGLQVFGQLVQKGKNNGVFDEVCVVLILFPM